MQLTMTLKDAGGASLVFETEPSPVTGQYGRFYVTRVEVIDAVAKPPDEPYTFSQLVNEHTDTERLPRNPDAELPNTHARTGLQFGERYPDFEALVAAFGVAEETGS